MLRLKNDHLYAFRYATSSALFGAMGIVYILRISVLKSKTNKTPPYFFISSPIPIPDSVSFSFWKYFDISNFYSKAVSRLRQPSGKV